MSAPLALIMAGGTGGHVYPALALARELRARSWRVLWLGTRRGLEARVVPADNIPIEWLAVGGLRGKGPAEWLAAPFRLARSLWAALVVMRRHRPAVVVGLGGFVSGPGGVAAWLARRPLLVHEQNAIAGFTNRCLARLAREVYAAFPGAFGGTVAAHVIGNPVRDDIAATLHRAGVSVTPYARLFGTAGDTVYFQHTASGEPVTFEGIDTLVLCLGHQPSSELEEQVRALGVDVVGIGDCMAPRTAEEAVYEGMVAGWRA